MEDLLNFAQKYNVAVLVNVGKSLKNISSASIASIFYVANNFFDDSKRRFMTTGWIKGVDRWSAPGLEFKISSVPISVKNAVDQDVTVQKGRAEWVGFAG